MGILHKTRKKLAKKRLKRTRKRAQQKQELADIYNDMLKEQRHITKAEKTIQTTHKERGPLITPETKKKLKSGWDTFQDWAAGFEASQQEHMQSITGSKNRRGKKREKEWWEW